MSRVRYFLSGHEVNPIGLSFPAAGHELADGIEYDLELSVVSFLQRGELACEIGVGCEHLPQAHESAHDFHIDQDGSLAPQDAGEHGDALFGEGIRGRAAKSTQLEITNCDFKCSNSRALSWNMKSAGNRSMFLFTLTSALASTS